MKVQHDVTAVRGFVKSENSELIGIVYCAHGEGKGKAPST